MPFPPWNPWPLLPSRPPRNRLLLYQTEPAPVTRTEPLEPAKAATDVSFRIESVPPLETVSVPLPAYPTVKPPPTCQDELVPVTVAAPLEEAPSASSAGPVEISPPF